MGGLIKGTFEDMWDELPNSIRPIRIDQITHALRVIDYAHSEVHSGSAYVAYHSVSLGNGEVLTIGFVTPNTTKWAHLTMSLTLTSTGTLDILEDVTSFDQGDAFTALNLDRNSANTSGITVTTGATGATLITPTGGSEIWNETLGAKGLQTTRENSEEIIMKQNSKYLFRFTNDAVANVCNLRLGWYEHTNKT